MDIKFRTFESQILYFNGMYRLPVAPYPTAYFVAKDESEKRPIEGSKNQKDYIIQRLEGFKKTILNEVSEVDSIINMINSSRDGVTVYTEGTFLTELADWLGDIIVYCSSEMVKYGLPAKDILSIIMESNFSKLGAAGEPIYDENGKVQKGPGYFKPEPKILAMIEQLWADRLEIEEAERISQEEKALGESKDNAQHP